jgi:hypothetical protein
VSFGNTGIRVDCIASAMQFFAMRLRPWLCPQHAFSLLPPYQDDYVTCVPILLGEPLSFCALCFIAALAHCLMCFRGPGARISGDHTLWDVFGQHVQQHLKDTMLQSDPRFLEAHVLYAFYLWLCCDFEKSSYLIARVLSSGASLPNGLGVFEIYMASCMRIPLASHEEEREFLVQRLTGTFFTLRPSSAWGNVLFGRASSAQPLCDSPAGVLVHWRGPPQPLRYPVPSASGLHAASRGS